MSDSKKELRKLLREAEKKGWRIKRGKKYIKILCPCSGKHAKTVHLSPDEYYWNHLRQWLDKTCWAKEEKR